MAVKNRTEAITEVNTKIVPAVTNTVHKDLLNNDILNSVEFRKDVIASETPAGGNVTIDYINKDTATVTTAGDLAVSFTNIENGDVRYLAITKAATDAISFVGALDMVEYRDLINAEETSITYRVSNKNGIIVVEGLFAPVSNVWTNIALLGSWSGTAKYRDNKFLDKIEIYLNITTNTAPDQSIGTMPAPVRPSGASQNFFMPYGGLLAGSVPGSKIEISSSDGIIRITDPSPIVLSLGLFSVQGLINYYKVQP